MTNHDPGVERLLNGVLDLTLAACREIVEAHRLGHDELEDGTNIWEYPLEAVNEKGKPYAVVIGTGGPHIEVSAHGHGPATLTADWGSLHLVRYDTTDEILSQFIDIYIERD